MAPETSYKPFRRAFAMFAVALLAVCALGGIAMVSEDSDAVSTTASNDTIKSWSGGTKTISVVGMYTAEPYSISPSWITITSVSASSVSLKYSTGAPVGTHDAVFSYASQAGGDSTVSWKVTVTPNTTNLSYEVGDSFSNKMIGQSAEEISGDVGGATLSSKHSGGSTMFNVYLNGTITKSGTYTITSDEGGIIYKITVTSSSVPVTSVSISGSSSVDVGDSITLGASVYPSSATDRSVTWSIDSGSSYVSIDDNGTSCTVTGVRAGTATIRCEANDGSGEYDTQRITVSSPSYTCYLYYDPNGGSGGPDDDSYTGTSTSSHKFTVSSEEPTRSGYTFLGWSTSSSASSATYTAGDTISVTYNGSKTLYAVWQENKQTYYAKLYYNANGGSGAPSTQSDSIYASSASGSKSFTISSTKPTRSGYDFLGWSTSSSASSASYQPGGSISVSYGSSKTLYAVWKQAEYTSTLIFDANGGSGAPSKLTDTHTTTTSHTFAIPSTKPTKSGYIFLGWSDSKTASAASYQPGGSISVPYNGTKTLYAVWEQAEIAITSNPALTSLKVGQAWSYTPAASVDGCAVSVSGADWLSASNGKVSGTPTKAGTYTVTITLEKDGYESATQTFTLKVYSALGFDSEPSSKGILTYVSG